MNKLIQFIFLEHFEKSLSKDDLVAQQRLRLFRIGGLISLVVLIGFSVQLQVVAPGERVAPLLIYVLFTAVFVNYLLLNVHKKQQVTYAILILIWFLMLHIDTYYSGGVRNAANFYLPSIIITAYILLGKRGGLAIVLASVAHMVYFFVIGQQTDWVSNAVSGDTPLLTDIYFLITTVSGLLSLNALSNYLEKSKNAVIEDIRAKKNELTQKNSELQKLSLIVNQTSNGVIVTDSAGRVEWVNDGFSRITGWRFEEAVGRLFKDLFPKENSLQKVQAYLTGRGPQKEPFVCEAESIDKGGARYWVQLQAQPLLDVHGERFFCMLTDITEKVALQQMVIEEKVAAQQEIAKAIIATQEKERSEIGKELHDNVNQILTTAKLYVENISYYPEQKDQFVLKGRDLIQKSITEIRYLCKALITPVIRDLGFLETLLELIESYNQLKIFQIEHSFSFADSSIDKDIKLTIYRIFQEQLNNAVKYSKATVVSLAIGQTDTALTLYYQDNGVGFDAKSGSSGLGLNNIKNRAEVFQGKVSIRSAPGEGCIMVIRFPAHRVPLHHHPEPMAVR